MSTTSTMHGPVSDSYRQSPALPDVINVTQYDAVIELSFRQR